jgi:hypothetical protein
MTLKKMGRDAAPQKTIYGVNSSIRAATKALIVGGYCWGVIPLQLADWLIRRLRLGGA